MKKLLLASISMLFVAGLSAQASFSVVDAQSAAVANGSTIIKYVDQATGIETHDFEVTNNNANSLSVRVRKTIMTMQAGQTFYFCTDLNCYPPNVSLSSSFNMASAAHFDLITDFTPNSTTGISTVRYTVFNVNNASDSTFFFIEYHVSPTGIATNSQVKANIGTPNPNPASSTFNMSYNLGSSFGKGEAKLVVYNMLGAMVKSETLVDAEGNVRMDVSTLEAGVYFTSLEVDGKQVATKRLVVTH